MKTDYLKYTGFEFVQAENGYKVNTDTVSLGMFLDDMKNKSVMYIGTNTCARRSSAARRPGASIRRISPTCSKR